MGTVKRKATESPTGDSASSPPPQKSGRIDGDAAGITCLHDVSYPDEGYDVAEPAKAPPSKPAKEFSFELDPFQKEAIHCLDWGESVMVQIDVENFVQSFRPDIMEAVYSWTKGAKFYEIMEIIQVFEGSLIRAVRRLEEILQQLHGQQNRLEKQNLRQSLKRQFQRSSETLFSLHPCIFSKFFS